MSNGQPLAYPHALKIAAHLVNHLGPLSERVEIAGSLRRQRVAVNDIELVLVPKWEARPSLSLLDDAPGMVNLVYEWAMKMRDAGRVRWIHRLKNEIHESKLRPEAKQLKGLLPNGAQFELYLTTPEKFGVIFLIRTGSAEFSQAVVMHAKAVGKPCVDGCLMVGETPLVTPEERDVFDALGLAYVEPQLRVDAKAVKFRPGAMPRLSRDLTGPIHPLKCQSCGAEDAGDDDAGPATLTRWIEHDENDKPENIVVVLCEPCGKRLIDKHPRLYDYIQRYQPCTGAMSICVPCSARDGTRCTHVDAQQNGGAGLAIDCPQPNQAHINYGGGRGEFKRFFRDGPVKCAGRNIIIKEGRE